MDLEDAVREDPDTQGCVGAHVGERPRGDRKQRSKERLKKRPIVQDFFIFLFWRIMRIYQGLSI